MSSRRDYRDTVIETLADSEGALREQVEALAERAVVAEADLATMRLVAVADLHHAHDLHVENVRLTGRVDQLRDALQALRAQLMAADTEKGTRHAA